MARAAPSADGWVMCEASADMPKPTISAWMRAPRARAASSDSSTNMAEPSPRIMPWRSLENGRQVSGETTRMASQALRMPQLKGASLPPVIASGAAGAGAGDDGGVFAQLGGPLWGGGGDRFARGDDGKLGEAVHEIGAAIVEVRSVGVVGDLGAVLETDPGHVGGADGSDAGAAGADGGGEFEGVAAECTDGAGARDGHAHHGYWAAGGPEALSVINLSMPSHICRTLRTARTASSGMLMSNSFSRANRISTAS